jgi:hypothetical protein
LRKEPFHLNDAAYYGIALLQSDDTVFVATTRHSEVAAVQSVSPEAMRLARQLRQLRLQHWPDVRLTQQKLARALSAEEPLAAATLSSWESASSPKLPPRHRLLAYARFFATRRSVEAAPQLLPFEALTPDEQTAYKKLEAELLQLRSLVVEDSYVEDTPFSSSWHFTDNGPVTLICAELPADETGPLASPSNPNYTLLQKFADVDALVELHGHVRAENPEMAVHFMMPSEVSHDDLTGHIILIGGVVWNEITGRVSRMAGLPVRQVEHPRLQSGEIFLVDGADGKEKEFWPQWTDSEPRGLVEDVGLLARVPNPLNSSRTLTICNGIHSRGVYGAVRSLTDTHLRNSNERYIAANFENSASFAILMSVQVIRNRTMTPDFNSDRAVLYQWSMGRTGSAP